MAVQQAVVEQRTLNTPEDIVAWVDEYRAQGCTPHEAFEKVGQAIKDEGCEADFFAAGGPATLVSYVWRLRGRFQKQAFIAGLDTPDTATPPPVPMVPLPIDPAPSAPRHDLTLLQTDAPARQFGVFDVRYYIGGDHVLLGDLDHQSGARLATHLCKLEATYGNEARFITSLTATLPDGETVRAHYTEAEVKRLYRQAREG